MKKLLIGIFIVAVFVISSCGDKKPETDSKKDSSESKVVKKDSSPVITKELRTNTGKSFLVYEMKPSNSVSNYFISGSGFENYNDTIRFPNQNPMVNALTADLDKDGFDEAYILTRATGSGSIMDILGISSLKDKSYSEIHVYKITAEDIEMDKKFSGYQGHDSIYISGNMLIREFPVYKSGDSNAAPTGGRRKLIYSLTQGEAAYQLKITGEEKVK